MYNSFSFFQIKIKYFLCSLLKDTEKKTRFIKWVELENRKFWSSTQPILFMQKEQWKRKKENVHTDGNPA